MELSPSDKGRIEHQFDSFCKLVLVCEMKDYKKMILRKMAKEILFSELILIYGYDLEHKKVGQEEIKDIFSIKVMGFDITIKNIRFHDLRHSCASLLLKNGVPMKQIQEWLGHSDFSTTANIYAHLDCSSKLISADAMLNGLGMDSK